MKQYYRIKVAGLERDLPICKLNEELCIAGFVIFGDVELTCRCAEELLKRAPEYDVLITAESKGIPLAHEMARQNGTNTYLLARKAPKLYMQNPRDVKVRSITTAKEQHLFIEQKDIDAMNGKRVLIVDDVISTGESLAALETLVREAGGNIVGRMAILAEGDAAKRPDLTFLAELPLFDKEGNVLA